MSQYDLIREGSYQDETPKSEKEKPPPPYSAVDICRPHLQEANGGSDLNHDPPTYAQAQLFFTGPPNVQMHTQQNPTKTCLTWRNSAMLISLLKTILTVIHMGMLSYTLHFTSPMWGKYQDFSAYEEENKHYQEDFSQFPMFILVNITLQAIITSASMLGFYSAFKRNCSMVLISVIVSIVADSLPIIVALTMANIGALSSLDIVGSVLEALFFCVMICYYRYLKKKKNLSRS